MGGVIKLCTIIVTVKHSGDNCESVEKNKGPRIDPCGTPCKKIKSNTAENYPQNKMFSMLLWSSCNLRKIEMKKGFGDIYCSRKCSSGRDRLSETSRCDQDTCARCSLVSVQCKAFQTKTWRQKEENEKETESAWVMKLGKENLVCDSHGLINCLHALPACHQVWVHCSTAVQQRRRGSHSQEHKKHNVSEDC